MQQPGLVSAGSPPADTAREVLRFDRVGLSYDGRPVLEDLSFSVRAGETVALLGPSGCGKTTLLNIVAGFLKPSAGVALCNQREIAGPGPDRGVVFQSYALFDWMTVEDNIAFSLRCAGRSRADQLEVAHRMAARWDWRASRSRTRTSSRVGCANAAAWHAYWPPAPA